MLMHGFPAQDGFDVQLDESLCHWVKKLLDAKIMPRSLYLY